MRHRAYLLILVFVFGSFTCIHQVNADNTKVTNDGEVPSEVNEGHKWTPIQIAFTVFAQLFPQNWDVYGFRFSGINSDNNNVCGLDFGLMNFAKQSYGIQIGFANRVDEANGVQIGVFVNEVKSVNGLQIGLINRALSEYRQARGLQIGLLNQAVHMEGVQIGLVNIIEDSPMFFMPIINAYF